MRILLLTPPLLQPNAPYSAMPLLGGELRRQGHETTQVDISLELLLRLFSRAGLTAAAAALRRLPTCNPCRRTPAVTAFLAQLPRYLAAVEPTIRFLQGRDSTFAWRIATRKFLPEGPRFAVIAEQGRAVGADPLVSAFGNLGINDRAKYLASLYLDDLADMYRDGIDPHFGFARYADRLAGPMAEFAPLNRALCSPPNLINRMLAELVVEQLESCRPQLVLITIPFPGTLLGALRIAGIIRARMPKVPIAAGGGYVNTELRRLAEPRIFDWFDYLALDDGSLPLRCLIEHLAGKRPRHKLARTFLRHQGRVQFINGAGELDQSHRESGPPVYAGLPLDRYFSLLEMPNPMLRLWSDGRWNRLQLAHGCYWHRCRFCDTGLDHIRRYDPAPAERVISWIEAMVAETGQTGFHFTDEAAPPSLLRELSRRLIARRLAITWWTNIRFDRAFTPELCRLLARAGCVAVTGGLEAPVDRLLRLMDKGFTVAQASRVMTNLAGAGIMVHAYLMYGLPTQTEEETVAGLERVRRLFAAGCLHSAFWHRFALTAHSPFARDDATPGLRLRRRRKPTFAENELRYCEDAGRDDSRLGRGLVTATYNYMLGVGLDREVRTWFD